MAAYPKVLCVLYELRRHIQAAFGLVVTDVEEGRAALHIARVRHGPGYNISGSCQGTKFRDGATAGLVKERRGCSRRARKDSSWGAH
jgi:hypothetical protein